MEKDRNKRQEVRGDLTETVDASWNAECIFPNASHEVTSLTSVMRINCPLSKSRVCLSHTVAENHSSLNVSVQHFSLKDLAGWVAWRSIRKLEESLQRIASPGRPSVGLSVHLCIWNSSRTDNGISKNLRWIVDPFLFSFRPDNFKDHFTKEHLYLWIRFNEISESHGGEYVDSDLLDCDLQGHNPEDHNWLTSIWLQTTFT